MTLLAVCQIAVALGRLSQNLEKIQDYIQTAADEGANLIVFPELSLSGYFFEDDAELERIALDENSDQLQALSATCQKLNTLAVVGFVERTSNGYFNTAGVFGVSGYLPRYRKVHLPGIGIDNYLSRGDLGFPVFELSFARIGINICYDQRFPESARALALQGAQIVIVPTGESMAHHEISNLLPRTRAYENRVFYVWANRVGEENGMLYTGSSKLIDPFANILNSGDSAKEEIIYAEIEPEIADDKRASDYYNSQGYEQDLFGDRSPENYYALVGC